MTAPYPDIISTGADRLRARLAAKGRSVLGIYRCGLHSGFPRCCIRFFVNVWWPALEICEGLGMPRGTWDVHESDLDQPIDGAPASRALIELRCWLRHHFHQSNKGFDYIPCPACIDRPPVQVRTCWRPEGRSRCELAPAGMRKTYRKDPDGTWQTILRVDKPTIRHPLPGPLG